MLQVTGIGVRNLRSLRDTDFVELKPLTILVGRNSAGKSSFARVMPLLKQSAERRKQAPLLWFGRLVDFGSFSEAVSSFAREPEIDLLLRFRAPSSLFLGRRTYRSEQIELASSNNIDVQMRLGSEGDDSRTVLRQLVLNVYGVEVRIEVASARDVRIFVDGIEAMEPTDVKPMLVQGAILPQLGHQLRERLTPSTISDASLFQPERRGRLGQQEARTAISTFVHGNTVDESKDEIAARLPVAPLELLLEHCCRLASTPETWRQNMQNLKSQGRQSSLVSLQRALLLSKLDVLLSEMDDALQAFCNGISYLEPLRATAQRYYRREEVSIDELDPKGLNTTFFIQGLAVRERDALNSWLSETFGFTLAVRTAGGHTTLNIQAGATGPSRNMADVGLGYSQIAPVAIQLWSAIRSNDSRPIGVRSRAAYGLIKRDAPTVVIEQPELHLHPAYQAKLADVFASCVNSKDETQGAKRSRIRLVAETHSPNLINRLGELVGDGKLDAADVQVLVFEPDELESTATRINVATFDASGVLRNWPIGFFDH
jgi:AAA ATPase domain/Protein of unknown function (DUF3696)